MNEKEKRRTAGSPSRTYVIRLNKPNFEGFFFKKFRLPEEYRNTNEQATWFFYNRVDSFSCGEAAYPIEEHEDVRNS